MNKEIYFEEEARDKLLQGVDKLCKAVSSTLGPNGRTVIISDVYGNGYVTKDGVSVAKAIELQDPVENLGAKLLKEVAEKTASEAGDGTTTSIVLASAFINNLKDFKYGDLIAHTFRFPLSTFVSSNLNTCSDKASVIINNLPSSPAIC